MIKNKRNLIKKYWFPVFVIIYFLLVLFQLFNSEAWPTFIYAKSYEIRCDNGKVIESEELDLEYFSSISIEPNNRKKPFNPKPYSFTYQDGAVDRLSRFFCSTPELNYELYNSLFNASYEEQMNFLDDNNAFLPEINYTIFVNKAEYNTSWDYTFQQFSFWFLPGLIILSLFRFLPPLIRYMYSWYVRKRNNGKQIEQIKINGTDIFFTIMVILILLVALSSLYNDLSKNMWRAHIYLNRPAEEYIRENLNGTWVLELGGGMITQSVQYSFQKNGSLFIFYTSPIPVADEDIDMYLRGNEYPWYLRDNILSINNIDYYVISITKEKLILTKKEPFLRKKIELNKM